MNPDQVTIIFVIVSEKKVLIITYYWPPFGGSGVQRWLKFVKYLPELGWTPYVFTPENPAFGLRDESLLADVPAEAEVIHFPIWEPYKLFSLVSGAAGRKSGSTPAALVNSGDASVFARISKWLRGNLFIPDPRRFWVRPSVSFLADFITENKIRTIVTTGPPHSLHLIGLKLKKKIPALNWVADFRDPWSEWGFLDTLRVSGAVRQLHKRLEKQVLRTADSVVTITPFYVKQFERLGGRHVHLVTNGFDEEDFAGFRPERVEEFVIRHVGIVNERCDPTAFMMAMKELYQEGTFTGDPVVEFIGDVNPGFRLFVERDEVIRTFTRFVAPVPHDQLMSIYRTSAVHLLVLQGYKDAEGYLPGKLFEYLATGIPVLGIGPSQGDAAFLLKETQQGIMIDASDHKAIKEAVKTLYTNWKAGVLTSSSEKNLKYSRRKLTEAILGLFTV